VPATAPTPTLTELSPADVRRGLDAHAITLIDVREPHEFLAERIRGALLFPLSTFDPALLPNDPNRPIVLQCGSGKRSATAVARCIAGGAPISQHLAGGIAAWKRAGLLVIATDPATGAVVERR